MAENDMNRTDLLAIERTKLANERTSLAYFRTFVVFLGSGLTILKVEFFDKLNVLGYFFVAMAFVILIVGVARFFYTKKQIEKIAG
jgi:putative membrane protein